MHSARNFFIYCKHLLQYMSGGRILRPNHRLIIHHTCVSWFPVLEMCANNTCHQQGALKSTDVFIQLLWPSYKSKVLDWATRGTIGIGGVKLKYIDDYAASEWANDSKLHIYSSKHNADTYSKHSFHPKTMSSFEADPHSNIWNHMKPNDALKYVQKLDEKGRSCTTFYLN